VTGIGEKRRHSAESVVRTVEFYLGEWLRSTDELRGVESYGRSVRLTMNTGQTFDVSVREMTASSKEASELVPGDVIEWCEHACVVVGVSAVSDKLVVDVYVKNDKLDETDRRLDLHYLSGDAVKLLHLSGRP
jgi:hypothetical protein